MGQIDHLDEFWTWTDLEQAVMRTVNLPRRRTYVTQLIQRASQRPTTSDTAVCLPREVLHILDEARVHLQRRTEDLNGQEIAALCLSQLDLSAETRE